MNDKVFKITYSDMVHKLMPNVIRDADFITAEGDFAYGDSNEQDMHLILQSGTGNWYQYPRIGFNLRKKLNSSFDRVTLKQQIIDALKEDNIIVQDLQVYTISDVEKLGIKDPEIISRLEQDKIIISAKISR